MHAHTATSLFTVLVLLAGPFESTFAQEMDGESAASWRAQASSFIDQIDEDAPRDRALYELNQVRVLAGDLAAATKDAPRIENPHLRCLAHFLIAKYYELAGDHNAALTELQNARPVAVSRGFTFQMVDAYLDIARSPDMGQAYVSEATSVNQDYPWQFLAGALARRGHLERALQIVNRKVRVASQQRALTGMGSAAAEMARIEHAEQIAELITDVKQRDGVWLSLVRALKLRSRSDEAQAFAVRISDPLMRVSAESILGQVAGQGVDEITADSLCEQIEKAESAKVKRQLYDSLLKKQIAAKDVPGAEASIEAIVKLITESKFEAGTSKFGNVDDSVRIALARCSYLQLAGVLAESGEQEASREMLTRAEQVIVQMPDSSGLAKMMQVSALLNTQIALGDVEGARRTVTSTQPVFWRVGAGRIAKQFIEAGEFATARFMAEAMLDNKGAGGADVVSAFLSAGRDNITLELLNRVDDSDAGAAMFREVGQAMIELDKGRELGTWLPKFTAVAQANLCIGAARTAGTILYPASSDFEHAIVQYLTVPAEILPQGVELSEQRSSNPGIHPPSTVPGMAISFQHYRNGEFVKLESAATAQYKDTEGAVEVHVTCYELPDAATASQILKETYIAPFKDWYVQKDRFLISVSSRMRSPKCLQTRDAIHKELESRTLVARR